MALLSKFRFSRNALFYLLLLGQLLGSIYTPISAHAESLNSEVSRCSVPFGKFETKDQITFADGVMVTGDYYYPLATVQYGLNLIEEPLKPNQVVLDVAAGFSPLAEYLRSQGHNASSVDIWYSNPKFPETEAGRLMKQFVERNRQHLITSQAQNLPFENDSVDVVLSHLLVNNIEDDQLVVYMVKEAYRVIRPGGELRFYGLDMDRIKLILNEFPKPIPRNYEMRSSSFPWKERIIRISHALLTIKKPATPKP